MLESGDALNFRMRGKPRAVRHLIGEGFVNEADTYTMICV